MLTGKQLHPFDKYKSVDGMMWGIMIPELFEHPFEGNVVSTAYLKFDQWALSGGTEYPDWYKDLEGYRDNTKIYSFD
jgi:LruC domain-containing protein